MAYERWPGSSRQAGRGCVSAPVRRILVENKAEDKFPSTAKYPTIRDGAGRTSASQVLKNEAAGISPRTWITEDGWTTIQGARILLGTGRAELGARLNM